MMLLAIRGLSQQQLLRQQRVSLQEKFSSPSLFPKIRINGSQRFFVLQVSSSCLRNNRANNFKMIRASLLSTKSKGETEEQRLNYYFSLTVKSIINENLQLCNNSFNTLHTVALLVRVWKNLITTSMMTTTTKNHWRWKKRLTMSTIQFYWKCTALISIHTSF